MFIVLVEKPVNIPASSAVNQLVNGLVYMIVMELTHTQTICLCV
jgi:hypothetical protein